MKKILVSIISLFLCSNVYAQQNFTKVRIQDFSGGQFSNAAAHAIELNQGELMQNVVINSPGRISKRKGQALFNADVGSIAFTGIGRFDPDSSTTFLTAASGVNVLRSTPSDSSWTIINPGDNQTANQDTEFTQANKLLFVYNGEDETGWYDGSTFTRSTGAATSPPTATTAAWLRNFLFLGGNDVNEDWVYFSNNLQPEVFTADDLFRVNTGDGQKVVKLETFKLNELIIYKERSVYVLDITGTTPLTDWTLQPITRSVGTLSPRSVINLGNDQWFLSSAPIAVRSLSRTSFDKILVNTISQPIQDILDGTGDFILNKAQVEKAAAVLFDNKYILAIAVDSSSVNNLTLVYDFLSNSWNLITGWFPAAWQTWNKSLYYIDANDGRVIECFTSGKADFGTVANGASGPTVAIDFDYKSPGIEFENPENFKQLDAIELKFVTTGTHDAVLSINLDNDGFTEVGTISLDGDAITLPVALPFTLTSGGVAQKTFQLQRYGEFKEMQFRVEQEGTVTDNVGQDAILERATLFGRIKPWRRE